MQTSDSNEGERNNRMKQFWSLEATCISSQVDFPVGRPEKSTNKARIVLDGSTQQDGKSLRSKSSPGPKLQSDIIVKSSRERLRAAHDIGSSACFCQFLINSRSDSPPSSNHSPIYVLLWLFAILDKFYSVFRCLPLSPDWTPVYGGD